VSVSASAAMLVNYLAVVDARDHKVIVIETENVLCVVDCENSFDPFYRRARALVGG
jgi:hypothetical protein